MDKEELRRLAEAAREIEPLDDYEITRACDGNSTAHSRVMRPYLCAIKDPTTTIAMLDEIAAKDAEIERLRAKFGASTLLDTRTEQIELLDDQINAMRPVVNAAVKWFKDHPSGGNVSDDDLWHTVRAYEAKMNESE